MRTAQTLTRRGLLGVGAAMPILAGLRLDVGSEANANDAPASSQLHGGGYYRFGIGGFKATVISDGYGSVPFWPIFAANHRWAMARGDHSGIPSLTSRCG